MSAPTPSSSRPGVVAVLGRVLRRVGPQLRTYKSGLAVAFAALFGQMLLRLLEPWPLKFVFDLLTSTNGSSAALAYFNGRSDHLLLACALGLVTVAGLAAVCGYLHAVGFARIGNRVLVRLRADLYTHLQRLSPTFHGRARGGDLVIRVVGDIGLLKDVAVTAFLPLIAHAFVLVGMIAVMLWLHWGLTLTAMAVGPIVWALSSRLNRRIHDVARSQRHREAQLATTAAESIGSIAAVQSLSLERIFGRRFEAQNEQDFREGVRGKRLSARLERSVDFMSSVATASAVGFGGWLVLESRLTAGDLIVFMTYLRRSFRPVKDFAKYSARLSRAAAAAERVLSVLDREPEVQDAPDAIPAPDFQGAVRFRDVAFHYDAGHPVLTAVSFEAQPGELVALVGPSGSGKSTLTRLLLRLHDPTAGSVEIDGQDLRQFTVDSVRRQIGVVLQDTVLFAGTVRENIALGAQDASDADVDAAVRRVGCEDFVRSLPKGLDTAVGERGVTLSAGQRQLVSLCRMAIRDVPILVLDEPTSALDYHSAERVRLAMQRLSRGRTTLLVTHDLHQAAPADRIVRLGEGTVQASGRHEALVEDDSWYAEGGAREVARVRGT